MIKHFATVWYPGSFVSEDYVSEVATREKPPEMGPAAYAYQFHDREFTEQNGEQLLGKPKNHSPTYYLGQELTAEEAMAHPVCNDTARGNIRRNGYKRLVLTKRGQLFPIGDNDIVLNAPTVAPEEK